MANKIDVLIPASLNTKEFLAIWNEFLRWRREERKPAMTVTGQRRTLAKLAKVPVAVAIRAVEASIEHDWRGVDPEWLGGRGGPPKPIPDTHARYGTIRRCISCEKGPIDRHEIYCPECRKRDNDILAERAAKREGSS